MAEKRYTKVLVAHHSAENGCHAENGAVLYCLPRLNQKLEHGKSVGFLSASDHRTRSKFGWVASLREGFSLDEFIEQFVSNPKAKLDDNGRALVSQLLDAIAELPEGTPMAATYVARGVEKRTIQILFHKVFFARPKNAT